MHNTFIMGLVHNVALLLAMGLIYDVVALRWRTGPPSLRQASIGVVLGAIGIAVMLTPWQFAPGIIFDTRSVLLSIAGLFFGAAPTAVAMAMTAGFRLYLGGAGAWTGVAVILTSGAIGLAWRHFRRQSLAEISWRELYLFGLVVHLAMLLLMFTLPWATAMRVLAKISLPVLVIFPVGTALLGALMANRLRREQTQGRLQDAQQRLQLAVRGGNVGLWDWDLETDAIHFSPEWKGQLGYEDHKLPNRVEEWYERLHPDDRDRTLAAVDRFRAGVDADYEVEFRLRHADGSYRWILSRGALQRGPDGQPQRMFGSHLDITERKYTEEALKESEHKYRELVENANSIILRWTKEGEITFLNEFGQKFFGYTEDEIIGRHVMGTIVPETESTGRDLQPLIGEICADPKKFESNINENIRSNGERVWIAWTNKIIFDSQGQMVGILSIGSDISERKQVEAELVKNLAILNETGAIAKIGGWEHNLITGEATWTKALYDIVEIESGPPPGPSEHLEYYPQKDRTILAAAYQRALETGEPFDLELQCQTAKKRLFWVRVIGRPVFQEGKCIRLMGTFQDITDRKQAEEALRQSEELFRSLFDNMLNGFAYCKMLFEQNQPQDFIYLEVNRSFETLTGLQDVVGKKVSEVIPGLRESDPELLATYGRVALTGKPERFEAYLEVLQMWFAISVYSPAKEYFVVVFDVITDRKQAEEALQQRVSDLAALYAASQAFLGQIGVDETLTQACRLAVEQFKLKLAWVGTTTAEDYLLRPAAAWGEEAGYADAIKVAWDGDSPTSQGPGGRAIHSRLAAVTNRIETEPSFAPWREAALARGFRSNVALPMLFGGEVLGIIALYSKEPDYFNPDRVQLLQAFANQVAVALQKARLYEKTQRYAAELEDRVAERTAQLKSTNRELDRFAYSVSHDLRAPLRAMQGFSQALLEDYAGELDPIGQDYARRINAASERMDRLIQDLLAYSRLSREEMVLQPVSLEQTVAEALAHLEGDLRARQARVRVEPPLPEVQAHRTTLLQIVANLVSNAIKFTAPGVQPQVRLWAEDRGERMRLWVEDNGLGIAPEHQERIFRIFERLHGIESYPGTGIGLAIVKKGVERMGGQIGVESAPGQGSRFWVELAKAV